MLRKKVKVKTVKLKLVKDVHHFPIWQLLIFVLIFASIGGYFSFRSFAYLAGDPPTAPSQLTASAVNSNEVQISWVASSSEAASSLVYSIYRNNVQVGYTTALTYYNSGLSAATTYTYYVTAHDTFGYSPASNSVSITTPATPSAPTGLTAHAVSTSEVDLSWTASTNATGYMIFRNTGQINTTTSTSYKDTGRAASTTYSYYVEAYYQSAVYASAPSNTASATTLAPPTPPTTPSSLSAETLDDEEIDLSWTASTASSGIGGYDIYRNNTYIGSTSSTTLDDTDSLTAYYDTGLSSYTTYSYYVIARANDGGASSPSSSVLAQTESTTPPSAPTGFKATVVSANIVNLSWAASTVNQAPIKEYDVYEVTPPDDTDDNGVLDGTLIGSTTGTSYQVSGLSASTDYGFYVIAVDTTGNFSEESAEGLATTNTAGYAISVGLSASLTEIGNGVTGTVINTSGFSNNVTCTKKFDSDGSASDPSWSGSFSGVTSYSQVVYPPSVSTFYTFYSYELSCTNGASTAVSGIAVRYFSDDVTN